MINVPDTIFVNIQFTYNSHNIPLFIDLHTLTSDPLRVIGSQNELFSKQWLLNPIVQKKLKNCNNNFPSTFQK